MNTASPLQSKSTMTGNRSLALLLAGFALLLFVAFFAVPAWLMHRHYDDYIADASNKLAHYQRANSARPERIKKLENLKVMEPQKLYLKGNSSALASAELQELVKTILEANGGRLISISVAPPKVDGVYRQVTASVQMSSSVANLQRVLHGIESSQPLLFVDMINVRSQVQPGYRPVPGVEVDVFVIYDVTAFALATKRDLANSNTKTAGAAL